MILYLYGSELRKCQILYYSEIGITKYLTLTHQGNPSLEGAWCRRLWTAAGTVPAIVYYGTELINPGLFILCVFLISCSVSLLIGTATGTTGIVGVAMMVMARSGNVNLAATAGAIIAGSYFGDRCSPVSFSASFVACITETRLYDNLKSMFKTAAVPFIIAAVFYLKVSGAFPLHSSSGSINRLILQQFSISLVVLVPAFGILIFSVINLMHNQILSCCTNMLVAKADAMLTNIDILTSTFNKQEISLTAVFGILSPFQMFSVAL